MTTESLLAELESGRPDPRDLARADLIAFCTADRECADVLRKHGVTGQTLREQYDILLAAGAGQWAGAHFVPVSVLAYPRLLDHLLARRNTTSAIQLASEMIQLVSRGRFA